MASWTVVSTLVRNKADEEYRGGRRASAARETLTDEEVREGAVCVRPCGVGGSVTESTGAGGE